MAEILTTLALRPGMHVIDRDAPNAGEHVVAATRYIDGGQWAVAFADTPGLSVVGARHPWLDVTA
jgi:hypothetical protein